MKASLNNFILRLLIFSVVAFPFLAYESLFSYFSKTYEDRVYGNEIYVSLKKSNTKKKASILIIGDSVAKQLYDNDTYNGDVYSLACNQAVSLAGYYILLKKFIDHNKDQLPPRVILIIVPETFTNNLDQIFTFHYFLKPFYKAENKMYFTGTCVQQIKKIPFYYISQLPFVINNNWSPAYNSKKDTSFKIISPISNDYLIKIKQICASNHIDFDIYCPPIKLSHKEEIKNFSHNITEFKKCGLEQKFQSYFAMATFLPDSLFQDHIHFKKRYIPKDYFKITN